MKKARRGTLRTLVGLVTTLGAGCGGSSGSVPPTTTPAADWTAPPEQPKLPPSANDAAADKAKAKLAADFAELQQANADEQTRLTPQIRAAAKALATQTKPSTFVALPAILNSDHRRPGNAQRDPQRHPRETLEFFGIEPYQSVLEYGPGEGWYTELLAPLLYNDGKLYVTSTDPDGPTDQRDTYYGKRTKLFLDGLPEVYSRVETLVFSPSAPHLTLKNEQLDVVFLVRGMHGMVNNGTLSAWLAEFSRTLEVGGVLAVVQHRAPEGGDPIAWSKKGYLPEAFVVEQVTNAGFRLVASSDLNANPADTKDYPEGVWSLPPTLRPSANDKNDKYKYVSIGESDRMTPRFIKAP